ncbi:protein of unknown function [Pelagirhabdus alkalitolerans]|uniref:DUF4190 domain-containing protein n=1 Tax=Pelagirhabdus alkalitolerans TaxID=1612202 RepID=A0A1G6H7V2_9BACI|nr:DUF4190 domain-containing protein [Pelagirhabdus alkalitolerans]SDB89526.1 protein of unknown function [Pelagirhabdus alkalitolerans]
MSEKTKTNSSSVVSLTMGILSILIPFLGLLLGVFGVFASRKATKEIEATREDGRGLAISGLICSSVGIVMQLFVVLGYIAFFSLTTVNVG